MPAKDLIDIQLTVADLGLAGAIADDAAAAGVFSARKGALAVRPRPAHSICTDAKPPL